VAFPLNNSTTYEQGKIPEIYLKNLANTTNFELCCIPFTKAALDTGLWKLRKLWKIMNQVVNLDQILTHNQTLEHDKTRTIFKKRKQDIVCLYGLSSRPKECNLIGDVAEFFLNPIDKVMKLAKGPKYADSKTKQDIADAALQVQISWYEREIAKSTIGFLQSLRIYRSFT
jgi:hypothetical protein